MLTGRQYEVEHDGDDYQVALILDGVQVGGALFPGELYGDAFGLAHEVGQAFINNPNGLIFH